MFVTFCIHIPTSLRCLRENRAILSLYRFNETYNKWQNSALSKLQLVLLITEIQTLVIFWHISLRMGISNFLVLTPLFTNLFAFYSKHISSLIYMKNLCVINIWPTPYFCFFHYYTDGYMIFVWFNILYWSTFIRILYIQ